jgi:hypothetical protein
MESNGKASCGQRSRHIDIHYFYFTDHAKRNPVSIEHCPTGITLAEYFTMPLQGSLFRVFRSVLLGKLPTSALDNGNHEELELSGSRSSSNRPLVIKCALALLRAFVHSLELEPFYSHMGSLSLGLTP